jgi:hypothetical protein
MGLRRARWRGYLQNTLRFIWGKGGVEPLRDEEADTRDRLLAQRNFVSGLLAAIPVVGVLTVTLNLLIQVKGNQSVALAIVQQLSLGTLALIISANLVGFLIPCIIVALTTVTADLSFSAQTRNLCMRMQIILIAIGLFTVSWVIVTASATLAFVSWRMKLYVPNAPKELSFPDWLSHGPPPVDRALRALWLEGRKRLQREGVEIASSALDPQLQTLGMPRELTALSAQTASRYAAIGEAGRRTALNAVFAVLMTGLTLYGFSTLISNVQFAPMERVQSADGRLEVGYVFSNAPGQGVFVPRDMSTAVPIMEMDLSKREICSTQANGLGTLASLGGSASRGVNCAIKG